MFKHIQAFTCVETGTQIEFFNIVEIRRIEEKTTERWRNRRRKENQLANDK